MHSSAHVTSIDAIHSFRVALQQFAEEAADALAAVRMEVERGVDYVQHDRMAYWPARVREGWDEIAAARIAVQRRRAMTVAGHRAAADEEKAALAQAEEHLRTALRKIDIVRHWCRQLDQEREEYMGRIGHLEHFLEVDLPRATAALERMVCALEAYTAIEPASRSPAEKASVARPDAADAGKPSPPPQRRPADGNEPAVDQNTHPSAAPDRGAGAIEELDS